ncbi:hypothetical protein CTAYLR_006204, partial [Chrysophaeum taylorii]
MSVFCALVGIAWLGLLPAVSIMTGEAKPRSTFFDETTLAAFGARAGQAKFIEDVCSVAECARIDGAEQAILRRGSLEALVVVNWPFYFDAKWLAKSVIFVRGEDVGGWLEAYRGDRAMARAGVIRAALIYEKGPLDVRVLGANGALPNLDLYHLIATALLLDGEDRGYLSRARRLASWVADYLRGPTGAHAHFLRYGIDALTVVSPRPMPVALELAIRALNTVEHELAHAYFMYWLAGPRTFVSVDEYAWPLMFLVAAFAFRAWNGLSSSGGGGFFLPTTTTSVFFLSCAAIPVVVESRWCLVAGYVLAFFWSRHYGGGGPETAILAWAYAHAALVLGQPGLCLAGTLGALPVAITRSRRVLRIWWCCSLVALWWVLATCYDAIRQDYEVYLDYRLLYVGREIVVELEKHVVVSHGKCMACSEFVEVRTMGAEVQATLDDGRGHRRTKNWVFRSDGEGRKFCQIVELEKKASDVLEAVFRRLGQPLVAENVEKALERCRLETGSAKAMVALAPDYLSFFELFLGSNPRTERQCMSRWARGASEQVPETSLLAGEKIVLASSSGNLFVTNYRLKLAGPPPFGELSTPHGAIHKIEIVGNDLRIECRDHHKILVRRPPRGCALEDVRASIETFAFPDTLERMFAFSYHHHQLDDHDGVFDGWELYDARSEYSRLGLDEPPWRLWSDDYDLVPTYPLVFAVPALDDLTLREAAAYRSKRRLPAAAWRSPRTGAVLCRSSQPMAGIAARSSRADQALLDAYRTRGDTTDRPLHIVDCRGRAAALGNAARGKGTESVSAYKNATLKYCDVGNIHTMRESQQLVCKALEGADDDDFFFKAIDDSKWLRHLLLVLRASAFVATALDDGDNDGSSVLVHCSDGWDRTAQVSALAQLILDPYYRTLRGFAVLVEKEWLAFGHKFGDRLGVGRRPDQRDQERSPVFVQWLEAVNYLLAQFPQAFEFTEDFLVFLADASTSALFGTFLGDSERQRKWEMRAPKRTVSAWTYALERPHFRRTD